MRTPRVVAAVTAAAAQTAQPVRSTGPARRRTRGGTDAVLTAVPTPVQVAVPARTVATTVPTAAGAAVPAAADATTSHPAGRASGRPPYVRTEAQREDDALVLAARAGNDTALAELLIRYRPYARAKARSYFLVGADREDIVQEGMIGLYKAIRDFNPDLDSSFRAFAELCVTRQIITAIKGATRYKHAPLNTYVSLGRPIAGDEDGDRVLADVLPGPSCSDPAELVISAERIRALQAYFDEVLSDLEVEVLRLYVDGKSYAEIADVLQRHVKSIDNALQRIKRKLECHLRDRVAADAG